MLLLICTNSYASENLVTSTKSQLDLFWQPVSDFLTDQKRIWTRQKVMLMFWSLRSILWDIVSLFYQREVIFLDLKDNRK